MGVRLVVARMAVGVNSRPEAQAAAAAAAMAAAVAVVAWAARAAMVVSAGSG